MKKSIFAMTALAMILLITSIGTGCTSSSTTTTNSIKPGSGAVVNSDSVVTATIESITKQSAGYPWKLEVLIQSTVDVNNLPNPVKDNVGNVVTVVTDKDVTTFKVGDVITGEIKYVGDANIPSGISLYMALIALEVKPTY